MKRSATLQHDPANRVKQDEMTSRLVALCFDANEPLRLARFWSDALHWEIDDETHDEVGLVPTDSTRFRIEFAAVPEQKTGTNRLHLDLTTTSIDDQKETVARLVELGARRIDIGQSPDEGHVVLADPEGNEFCVIEPNNNFLAGCERLESISDKALSVGLSWPIPMETSSACRRPASAPVLGWHSRAPGCAYV